MKNKLSLLVAIITIFGCVHHANASDFSDSGRVSAVVELTDGELQSLLQTGAFKMSIPARMKNKIDSLILKRPDRFKDDVAVLFNDVDKRFNTIAISIDDSTIEQIAYQPVELKIYESGYTNIMVRYCPGNRKRTKEPSKTDSVELKIRLNNGKSLIGRLSYMTQFPLKSGLGKVKVKLEEISQITFDEDGDLKVEMLNGDKLMGESNFSSVVVNSRWGQERIKTEDIASIASTLAQPPSVNRKAIQSAPLTNGSVGHPTQGYSAAAVLPPAINQPFYGQVFHQHQFPMATGRIDTVPRSPRISRPHTQIQPNQIQPNNILSYPIWHAPQPVQQHPVYGGYSQHIMPSQNQIISAPLPHGAIPMNHVPLNQVPISNQPIIDSLIGQPLPMMTPNQANESWLFPQN